VLPGVHHRLVANQREVVNLRSFVATGFEAMTTQMSDAFESQEAAMKERDRQTGEHYLSLAQRLLGEGSSPVSTSRGASRPTLDEKKEERQDTTTTTIGGPRRPHSLVMKHKSLTTIYYEWYGLESYKDTPVVGGISFLEKTYKTKWRAHFSPAEKQYFSRLQKVIRGIEEQGKRESKAADEIVEEWEGLYQKDAKSSVTKMSQIIQEMGLVATRKARGKNRMIEQPVGMS
jgi:hypothetical protein